MNQQLYLWQFTPVARQDDPAWQGRSVWTNLQIAAATAGEAILLASRYDQAERGLSDQDSLDRQQRRSGLEDPLLYRCDRLHSAPPDLVRGAVVFAVRPDDAPFRPAAAGRGPGAAPVTLRAAKS